MSLQKRVSPNHQLSPTKLRSFFPIFGTTSSKHDTTISLNSLTTIPPKQIRKYHHPYPNHRKWLQILFTHHPSTKQTNKQTITTLNRPNIITLKHLYPITSSLCCVISAQKNGWNPNSSCDPTAQHQLSFSHHFLQMLIQFSFTTSVTQLFDVFFQPTKITGRSTNPFFRNRPAGFPHVGFFVDWGFCLFSSVFVLIVGYTLKKKNRRNVMTKIADWGKFVF